MTAITAVRRTRVQSIVLWLVALAVFTAGIWLTKVEFLAQEWVSRAGCLIVMLGIGSGVGGVIHERILLDSLAVRRRIALAGIRRRFHSQPHLIDEHIAEAEQAFGARGEALSSEFKFSIGLLEASLLLIGTLLWGFGDLVRLLWG